MNDLKEIGGFIVSADPFVQHDTSLSGNGTVNSPLGVVPGYNETVLYSGNMSQSNTADIPLSENITNFNSIKVYAGWSYNSSAFEWAETEIPIEYSAKSWNLATFGSVITSSTQSTSDRYITFGCYKFSNPSTISVINAVRDNNSKGAFNASDTLKIYKVVGINRKQ